ncbi:MAG TPA: adenylosuccinate lyase [archaeon]|nr:adenylosuccinate lyase [archaeon]
MPIDSGRYGSPEMREVFEEETRFQRMLDVEAALAWARAEVEDIPRDAAKEIEQHASTKYVTVKRIREIERVTEHETAAMVEALAEVSGKGGAYVHFGATSSDILDTALALQMKSGLKIVQGKLDALEQILIHLSKKYRNSVMIGRTHGQHALPMTLGLKFAVWLGEVGRHIERVDQCSARLLVGKMSGAIGTMAGLGKNALQIQDLVMNRLGLRADEVTTQIVQRDRYAELICTFAILASSLDKFATEVRNLQRPEIDELAEPFEEGKQVGSSAMPQKRNPWRSENISSLAKIERSLVGPSLEAIVTWHERDLSQSASERFIIPESFILTDHMLDSMIRILTGLKVNEQRMSENLTRFKDPLMSEAVMTALVSKGMPRLEAHKLLQQLLSQSRIDNMPFNETLSRNPLVTRYLSREEIEPALDARGYLGVSGHLVDVAVERAVAERRARGLGA